MKTLTELEAMTDDELRVMLAKLDEWEFCEKARTKHRRPLPWTIPHCRHPKHTQGIWRIRARLTDYPRCLNACHAIITKLTEPQMRKYADLAFDYYGDGTTGDMDFHSLLSMSAKTTTIFLILTLQQS